MKIAAPDHEIVFNYYSGKIVENKIKISLLFTVKLSQSYPLVSLRFQNLPEKR